MDNAWLVELTKATVEKVDEILKMSVSDYTKEYGVETDRVDKAKIEKAETMIGTLRFFIDKATGNKG